MRFEKDFLISEYKKGKEIRQIAKERNCSTATIVLLNREYGLSSTDYNPKYKYKDKKWLIEQFGKYKTVSSVAKKTGYPRTCVARYAEKYGLRTKEYTRNDKNNINENFFKSIDTEEKAYFLGFIMADGNIYEYADGRLQFSLKVKSADKDIVLKLAEATNFDKSKVRIFKSERNGTITESCELKSYNEVFCRSLMSNGVVSNKTGKEIIPNTVPDFLVKHFIRGFIDGDGWIHDYSYKSVVGACSQSKNILNDIISHFKRELSIELNILGDNRLYSIQTSAKKKVYSICKYLYKNSKIHLDRKYTNAINIIYKYIN